MAPGPAPRAGIWSVGFMVIFVSLEESCVAQAQGSWPSWENVDLEPESELAAACILALTTECWAGPLLSPLLNGVIVHLCIEEC